MKAVGIFFALLALDFIYARYTQNIVAGRAWQASLNAAMLYAITGFATLTYVAEPLLLIPAVVGAFTGTWLAVRKCG